MENKKKTDVLINGRNFTVVSNKSEEYTRKIAYHVDKSMRKVRENNSKLDYIMVATLAALNITNEYYELEDEFGDFKSTSRTPLENYELVCEQLKDANSRLEENRDLIEDVEKELEASKELNDRLFEQIKNYKKSLDIKQRKIDGINKTLSSYQAEIKEKEEEFKSSKNKRDKELEDLRTELVETTAQFESLKLKLEKSTQENDKLRLENTNLEDDKYGIEKENLDLVQNNSSLKEKNINLKSKNRELEEKIREIEVELKDYIDLLDEKHRKGRVKLKNIELLAPVGSEESLYAAVENGADAVYLGGELYSARKHASNFSKKELIEAVKYAHLNRVEVHVAVNILLEDKEVEDALDYVKFLYDIDVDGIIIQDMGLASLIREILPELPLHASTQMTINNLEGVKHLEEMGFTRVVLARETPLEEIENIVKNTSLEVEVFVHGALCVAYSGQCLMSSFIGGRSGNRGSCAQPCRMAYSIVDDKGEIVKDWEDRYILSSRDLNTIESIDKLLDIGVDSLKIEGRMKRPEYVATIVDKYRKAIDNGVDSISEDDKKDIEQIFNRSFTKGLTFEDFGNSFIAYDRPDNRGTYLGKVIGIRGNLVHVELEENLNLEDGIEFRLASGENKGMASDKSGTKGEVVILKKIGDIEVGSKLYKTSDSQLLKRARQSFENRPGKKVDMKFEAFIGNRPNLILTYGEIEVEVENEFVVENAKRVALDHKSIERQLSKLGDSYYELGELFTDIEEGSFLPVSIINELRRDAVEKLEEVLFRSNRTPVKKYENLKEDVLVVNREASLTKNLISVKIEQVEQFKALDLGKLDRIYIACLGELDEILEELEKKEIEKYLWTDKILETANLGYIKLVLDEYKDRIDGVSISNIGSLNLVRSNYPDLKIHGDTGLNIFNSYTGNYYRTMGVTSMTLSEELTLEQVNKISSKLGGELEIVNYGYLQSMIMKTCPMALIKGCGYNEDCDGCNLRKGYGLKDRMDKTFRFVRKNNQTTLYNSVLLMTLDSLDEIKARNKFYLKLNYTIEDDSQEIRDVHSHFYDYVNNEIDKREMIDFVSRFSEAKELTKGHFFRELCKEV